MQYEANPPPTYFPPRTPPAPKPKAPLELFKKQWTVGLKMVAEIASSDIIVYHWECCVIVPTWTLSWGKMVYYGATWIVHNVRRHRGETLFDGNSERKRPNQKGHNTWMTGIPPNPRTVAMSSRAQIRGASIRACLSLRIYHQLLCDLGVRPLAEARAARSPTQGPVHHGNPGGVNARARYKLYSVGLSSKMWVWTQTSDYYELHMVRGDGTMQHSR